MPKFMVVEGQHMELSGKVYDKGQIVNSDLDLDKLFRDKFKKVNKNTAQAVAELVDESKDEVVKTEEEEDFGKDVTAEFDVAVNNDLKVYRDKKKGVTIFDGSKKLNDKPFKSKTQVEAFLTEHVGDDEGDENGSTGADDE